VTIVYYIFGRRFEKKLFQKLEDLKTEEEKKDEEPMDLTWKGNLAMTSL
jgi:membrane protein DedA with SNARE-associated domain